MVGGLELLRCPPGSPPGRGQCLEVGPAPSPSRLYGRPFLIPHPEPHGPPPSRPECTAV